MASTRTKNLARAIQRANPNMKYTEALRHAEAGRIVIDPNGPSDALIDLYKAAGMDATLLNLSGGNGPLDPMKFATQDTGPDEGDAPFDAPLRFDPMGDVLPSTQNGSEPRLDYVDKNRPVYDLHPAVWDGEAHPDPLTFLLGHDLHTNKPHYVSLNGATAHMLVSGGTGTGKSSVGEIVAAQALAKSMPWDPDLFSTVMVLDAVPILPPRWGGRPGVITVNEARNAAEPDANGNPVTGAQAMVSALEWVGVEQERRALILRQHGAVSWVDLPDEIKRREGFAPLFVILDECFDQAAFDSIFGDTEDPHSWQKSRRRILDIIRKGRAFGVHLILISATPNGNPALWPFAMTQSMVQVLTGSASKAHTTAFFGPRDVPAVPTTRQTLKDGRPGTQNIPGRARVMSDTSQEINLIQTLAFGGRSNSEALDKWLPQGDVPPNGDLAPASGSPLRRD